MLHEEMSLCPHCDKQNEVIDNTEGDERPEAGDISICWSCKKISVFTEDLKLRLPTDTEMQECLADPHVRRVLAAASECYRPGELMSLLRN